MDSPERELRLPVFIEFAGSPKSGKSTIIGVVGHFLRRIGFRLHLPAEGASLRTPPALRDDWLAFNTWSACYALRNILEDAHQTSPEHLVILDRGLFDAAAWMEFLASAQSRLTADDRDRITRFLTMDLWRERELLVFLFTADRDTSLARENDGKLIQEPGSVMNAETLRALQDAYQSTASQLSPGFEVVHVDTSFVDGKSPSFKGVAFEVADTIVKKLMQLTSQRLLVTEPVQLEGFVRDPGRVNAIIDGILKGGRPQFMERAHAEQSTRVQQVVPYAVLIEPSGRYFAARRRTEQKREELRGKRTILVGGHAEEIDWDTQVPGGVFERCLRRELEEELIGIQIQEVTRLGVICDPRTAAGSQHVAILFEVKVASSTKIRKQATDQEFGREAVQWVDRDEIVSDIASFDPWSQLAAAELFGAILPSLPDEPTLFLNYGK